MLRHALTMLLTLQIVVFFINGSPQSSSISKELNQPQTACTALKIEWNQESLMEGEPQERPNNNTKVFVLWDQTLGYAAAALLRATLIAAGYDTSAVRLHRRSIYDDKRFRILFNLLGLVVEVKLPAQLHVRLTARAVDSPDCLNISSWSIEQLYDCDFLEPGTYKSSRPIVYVLNERERTWAARLITCMAARAFAQMDIVNIERSHLERFIQKPDRSFFFVDYDHWSHMPGVQVSKLPMKAYASLHCGLSLDKTVSLNVINDFTPVLSETFAVFSPSLNDLHDVIDLVSPKNNVEEAACEWARQRRDKFRAWREATIVKLILRKFKKSKIQIQVSYVDCLDTDWFHHQLLNWFSKNVVSVSQIAGVVLTEDIAGTAAPLAEKFQLPLLTYDVTSGESTVRSATGRLKYLVLAFRRLLADCGWRRIAVVSERTHFAAVLSVALRVSAAGLVLRERNVTSAQEIHLALQSLRADDARVFLVNARAATAAAVLAAAEELNITWNNGFTWIVREYNAADNATKATRPYSVSFSWRGDEKTSDKQKKSKLDYGDGNTKKIVNHAHEEEMVVNTNKSKEMSKNEMEKTMKPTFVLDTPLFYDQENVSDVEGLRTILARRWRGRAWPLHAAPLMDALLTFGDTLQCDFWGRLQRNTVSGINEEMSYDEHGVSAPLVFVRQWGEMPQPRLLATWRSGEWRESTETCPATDVRNDGFVHCIIPNGDPFLPTCNDTVWITSATIVLFLIVALIAVTVWWTRHALRAHEDRIKTEFAKRLLARRERVFEALAEHLVDRSALELHQELGNGRFGRVHLGVLREPGRKCGKVVVAAKALREEAKSAEESEFLREACMLAELRHDHIVRFVGVCVVDGPPLLLMEHAFFGDLLRYLQNRRYLAGAGGATNAETINEVGFEEKSSVSAETLTRFAREAATALAYIAQSGIVHRDVRASNCLVDERRSLKLADFGLARATGTVDGEYACRRGVFPVLWMAPETLKIGVCSAASDVWAFGVLVFELVTLGRRPYGSQPPPSVLRHVLGGGQPQLPWDASAETRALVRACWQRAPEARPTAAQLANWLSRRWRSLRPALVTELVDVDSLVYGNKEVELDFNCDNFQ